VFLGLLPAFKDCRWIVRQISYGIPISWNRRKITLALTVGHVGHDLGKHRPLQLNRLIFWPNRQTWRALAKIRGEQILGFLQTL
jgi:hypothetical protein